MGLQEAQCGTRRIFFYRRSGEKPKPPAKVRIACFGDFFSFAKNAK
jgi:hypothetical protein